MEKHKIDKVIDAFRSAMYNEFGVTEEAPTNSVGSNPAGFSSGAADEGPVAGFDPVIDSLERRSAPKSIKFDGRTKGMRKFLKKLEANRVKRKEKKDKKNAMNFNPYFTSWK